MDFISPSYLYSNKITKVPRSSVWIIFALFSSWFLTSCLSLSPSQLDPVHNGSQSLSRIQHSDSFQPRAFSNYYSFNQFPAEITKETKIKRYTDQNQESENLAALNDIKLKIQNPELVTNATEPERNLALTLINLNTTNSTPNISPDNLTTANVFPESATTKLTETSTTKSTENTTVNITETKSATNLTAIILHPTNLSSKNLTTNSSSPIIPEIRNSSSSLEQSLPISGEKVETIVEESQIKENEEIKEDAGNEEDQNVSDDFDVGEVEVKEGYENAYPNHEIKIGGHNFITLIGTDFAIGRLVNMFFGAVFLTFMMIAQGYAMWVYGIAFLPGTRRSFDMPWEINPQVINYILDLLIDALAYWQQDPDEERLSSSSLSSSSLSLYNWQ